MTEAASNQVPPAPRADFDEQVRASDARRAAAGLDPLSEDEAMALAVAEVRAVRTERAERAARTRRRRA
ncbi:MAG: hypothetical protein ACFCVF_12105 [Kineosporiaceae bacterium]